MHITVIGQGPDLVMIHGWSMHSGVWHTFADELSQYFTLHLVDLPGHGKSDWQSGGFDVETMVSTLKETLPKQATVLGWSLGGLIALAYAQQYPDRVKQLCLMAASPCFVERESWSCAMAKDVFMNFAEQLDVDHAATVQQFLLLQARGSAHSRQTIRSLAAKMNEVGLAKAEALRAGLALLISLDLRELLANITCPTMMILGERDTLIPASMAEQATLLNDALESHIIMGAGHAPFISHENECRELVLSLVGFNNE